MLIVLDAMERSFDDEACDIVKLGKGGHVIGHVHSNRVASCVYEKGMAGDVVNA